MKKYSLIIHGGCGAVHKFTPQQQEEFLISLERIVKSGEELLAQGKSALDVVEHCVSLLEDDVIYNAGKGSVLNELGEIEMDASIMDGKTLKAGAVAGLNTAKNPIVVARKVMEQTEHVMLIGEGAEKFVEKHQLAQMSIDYFKTDHRVLQLENAKKTAQISLDHGSLQDKLGTVGAVAFDINGDLAAATSTGGMTNKMVGRVGDTALIGCGTYADNQTCAISCTGKGEDFIRTAFAKYVSNLIDLKGLSASEAANQAIDYFKQKVNGYGGFILIDKNGEIADQYSTEGLIRAYVKQGSAVVCKLFA